MSVLHFHAPMSPEFHAFLLNHLDAAIVAKAGRVTLLVNPARGTMAFIDIVRWVAFNTGVSERTIVGPRRYAGAFRARAAAIWGGRVLLTMTLPQIGARLGERHHTTILAALARATAWRDTDPAFLRLTDRMLDELADGARS